MCVCISLLKNRLRAMNVARIFSSYAHMYTPISRPFFINVYFFVSHKD